jgi:hypothetical protein
LLRVLKGLFDQSAPPKNIIIIDGSPGNNGVTSAVSRSIPKDSAISICLIRSSHANTAYQRWLGFKESRSEVLVYFDDDVVFEQPDMMEQVLGLFSRPDVVGASVEVDYHNPLVQDPALRSFTRAARRTPLLRDLQGCVDWLTGLPSPRPGQVGLCGVRGPVPPGKIVEVAWLPGPCMVFRRNALSETCFPKDLLAIFERKLAPCDDLVISHSVGRTGRLLLSRDCNLKHPGDSETVAYPAKTRLFARSVSYSRLYVSLVIAQHLGISTLRCRLHYYYYALWRLVGASLRLFMPPYGKHLNYFLGWADGIVLNLWKAPTHAAWTPEINWAKDAERDGAEIETLLARPALPVQPVLTT